MLQLACCNLNDQLQSCSLAVKFIVQQYILVVTLLCPEGTEMDKHTVNTMEVILEFKTVESGQIRPLLTTTWSRCRSATCLRTQKKLVSITQKQLLSVDTNMQSFFLSNTATVATRFPQMHNHILQYKVMQCVVKQYLLYSIYDIYTIVSYTFDLPHPTHHILECISLCTFLPRTYIPVEESKIFSAQIRSSLVD